MQLAKMCSAIIAPALVVVALHSLLLWTPPAVTASSHAATTQRHSQHHQPHQQKQRQPQLQHRQPLKSETGRYRDRCWRANYSSPARQPVDHTPLPFLLGGGVDSPARFSSCRGRLFLLVMVQSAVSNRARRDLIRSTWASVANIGGDRLATVFFVGRSAVKAENAALRAESDSQADIVQADFIDSYRNLTYKHLYALKWISENCPSVSYVAKVDDDVVLNVYHLREALREKMATVRGEFFYCQLNRVKPIRRPGSKWHVTKQEWPGDKYPDYCKGYGYVMTAGLIVQLHQCAKWRRYFWVDDVFVTGDLATALGVRRIQWDDGWGSRDMHPRLDGPEAGYLVLVNEARNEVLPSLHRRVWRAMLRYSGEFA